MKYGRKSPKQMRKLLRRTEAATTTGKWTWGDTITLTNVEDADTIIYFDDKATTVTFPMESFSGFAIGDTITITGRANEKIKKKKKVHVARRRMHEKQETHTITDISTNTITIKANESTIITYLYDEWKNWSCVA